MKKVLLLVIMVVTALSSITQAYRDLETGTFLTRDPIGYADGPNVYCYVHCNPITHFDAVGLAAEPTDGSPLLIALNFVADAYSWAAAKVESALGGQEATQNLEMAVLSALPQTPIDDAAVVVAETLLTRGRVLNNARKLDQLGDAVDAVTDTSKGLKTATTKGDDVATVATKLNDAGDTTSSISTTANPQTPQQRGRKSEARVLSDIGEAKNTTKLETPEGNTIPDFINDNQVGEIKDTKTVSNTKQLRAQKEAAASSERICASYR